MDNGSTWTHSPVPSIWTVKAIRKNLLHTLFFHQTIYDVDQELLCIPTKAQRSRRPRARGGTYTRKQNHPHYHRLPLPMHATPCGLSTSTSDPYLLIKLFTHSSLGLAKQTIAGGPLTFNTPELHIRSWSAHNHIIEAISVHHPYLPRNGRSVRSTWEMELSFSLRLLDHAINIHGSHCGSTLQWNRLRPWWVYPTTALCMGYGMAQTNT